MLKPVILLTGLAIASISLPLMAQGSYDDCDPNYNEKCVQIANDVDCVGGKGNRPAYIGGPVYVVGSDVYGLDRGIDGVGCE